MASGEAHFFDGAGARRLAVTVEVREEAVVIAADGRTIVTWRSADLYVVDARKGVMRIGAEGAPDLARLEIRDALLQDAIRLLGPGLERRRRGGEVRALRIVAWSLAAVVSLILSVIYLVPLVADRVAPFVPIPMEQRIGQAVDNQLRALLGHEVCAGEGGQAALAKLSRQLTGSAELPMPADIAVLRSEVVNAVALPGGRIYVFKGLLDAADSPDELGGVIAHELGHVAHRDGLRTLLKTSGTAFLLGLMLGDVTGGGALIFATQTLLTSRYSREAEAAADAFSADLMLRLGRSPKPLGIFLSRIDHGGLNLAFLSSHPVTADRLKALEAEDRAPTAEPLLTGSEWQALKAICGSSAGATEI